MNYAMMTYTVARQCDGPPDMAGICRLAREVGLDTMDQITLYGYDAAEVRRIADGHGIRIVAYTFFTDLNFADAEARKPGLEAIREGLDIANVLGADIIMVPQRGKPEYTREESRRNAIAGFREAVALAEAAGMTFTTEHLCGPVNPFVLSSDMNEACEAVPGLKVTYDNGNVMTSEEDETDALLNSLPHIVHAHFKDWVKSPVPDEGLEGLKGARYNAALIGEGLLDYPGLLQAMRDSGYDGYVDIEYEGNDYPADEAIRRALDYLRQTEATLDHSTRQTPVSRHSR